MSESGHRIPPGGGGCSAGPRPRVLVVSPRPPRGDGQGDQRRASEIVSALSGEWAVEVVSWLPDVDRWGPRRWLPDPRHLLRCLALLAAMPAQVAYVQGRAPRWLNREVERYDAVVFVTSRAVPRRVPDRAVVDFVDDLGEIAFRRARSSNRLVSAFWKWEGRRMRCLDRRLVASATVCVAHSPADAAGIDPHVRTIPLSIGADLIPDEGRRIVFVGNLFYAPNHEAGMWICDELVPELSRRGVDSGSVLIAGRRPQVALRQAAAAAGVELQADVAKLSDVLAEAAVVIAPMRLGTGAQYKVLDAVGAGRPCVLSPLANRGLGFVDGRSALVADRQAEPFADAVVRLLHDPALRRHVADEARSRLAASLPDAVAASWHTVLAEVLGSGRRDSAADS